MISSNEELDVLQKGLLQDLLIKVKLLSDEEIRFSIPWSEKKEFSTLFNNAISQLSIPRHLLLTEGRYNMLDNWGFKVFTDLGRVSTSEIEKAAENFVTALYNLYAWVTYERYLGIPENPSILSLGCGDFMRELFMYYYFRPSSISGIELDGEKLSEAKENVKEWGLDQILAETINLIQANMVNLDKIEQLEDKKFDLILMRIPATQAALERTLKEAEGFLNDNGYIVLHIRNPELSLVRYKRIVNLTSQLDILSFNTYPLSGIISPKAKDKLIIFGKDEIEDFLNSL